MPAGRRQQHGVPVDGSRLAALPATAKSVLGSATLLRLDAHGSAGFG